MSKIFNEMFSIFSSLSVKEEMMIRLLKKAAIVAMFVGLGSGVAMAGDQDVALPSGGSPVTLGSGTNYYTSDGSVDPSWNAANVDLNGQQLTVGQASNTVTNPDNAELNMNLGNIYSDNLNGRLNVTQSLGTNDTGKGTHVTAASIDMNNGTGTMDRITIGDSDTPGTGTSWQNQLTVGTLNTLNGATGVNGSIAIGRDSLLNITNVGTTTIQGNTAQFAITLDRGTLQSAGTILLNNADISGNGTIDSNVVLNGAAGTSSITINGATTGTTQTYTKNVQVIGSGGSINIAGNASGKAQMIVQDTLELNGIASTANVSSSDAANNGILTANRLVMSNSSVLTVSSYGALEVGSATAQQSTLNNARINILTNGSATFNSAIALANGATINVAGPDSIATFNKDLDMATGTALNMANGATVDFSNIAGGYTLDGGSIAATGTGNRLSVGSSSAGITVANTGFLNIANGELHLTASKVADVTNPTPGSGNLTIQNANAINMTNGQLYANTVTVDSAVSGNLYGTAVGANELYAEILNVKKGAVVNDNANVATRVRSFAQIDGEFNVAGTNTVFEGGTVVTGTLGAAGAAPATLTVGTATNIAAVSVVNGTLNGGTGGLTIANGFATENSSVIFSGKSTVKGNVTANDFNLKVYGDITMEGNNTLTGDTYTQSGGTVANAAGYNNATIVATSTDAAKISGPTSAFAVNGTFGGDLNVSNGAKLVGIGSSWGNANVISTANPAANINIDGNSMIDLGNGSLRVNGYQNVNLAGSLRVGFTNGLITKLDLGNAILNTNLNGKLELDKSIVNYFHSYTPGFLNELNIGINEFVKGEVINNGSIAGSFSTHNVFGDYTVKYDNTGAWFSDYVRTDLYDTDAVRRQLEKEWGEKVISNGLAGNIATHALGNSVFANNTVGGLNSEIFDAFAYNYDSFSYTNAAGKTISGRMNRGLLAAYNGQSQAGVNYVSEDVSRELISTLHSRLDAYRKVKDCTTPANPCEPALGNLVLNPEQYDSRYLNRFWAGALGTWQDASRRNGFDGYKYDGKGAILGYDRAFGPAVVGVAASYIEGDYEDKTATRHDSEIKHYSGDIYATYNASSGFFTSVMGGFTHSDNDIRETRGGNMAREEYYTNTWHASAKVGFDFEPSEKLVITPTVGVDFFYSDSTAHSMKYAGSNKLVHYGSMSHNAVEIPVDVQVAYNVQLDKNKELQLLGNGGYAYNVNDHGVVGDLTVNGSNLPTYRAIGRKLGHHSWNAGVGAKLKMDNWDVGVKYDYYGRSSYDAHRVMGTVGYSF